MNYPSIFHFTFRHVSLYFHFKSDCNINLQCISIGTLTKKSLTFKFYKPRALSCLDHVTHTAPGLSLSICLICPVSFSSPGRAWECFPELPPALKLYSRHQVWKCFVKCEQQVMTCSYHAFPCQTFHFHLLECISHQSCTYFID